MKKKTFSKLSKRYEGESGMQKVTLLEVKFVIVQEKTVQYLFALGEKAVASLPAISLIQR